ncbi:zf-HC2 domain-containing protein [Ignavibacterium sp.]|uniref:zf-HC2 domain-containing protein n=1 Tax=Ignavibacterium sp. TaxID=2651167 RepID=UPI00307D03A8
MKCEFKNRESLISKYLLNERSDEESLKFEEHYFQCEECFKELRAAEDAFNFISNEGRSAFQYSENTSSDGVFTFLKTLSNPVRIGFAFASVVLVIVLYFALRNDSNQLSEEQKIFTDKESIQKQEVDTSIVQPQKQTTPESNFIAELSGPRFNPNPYYEEWINENVRSSSGIIDKVLSPAAGDTIISSQVLFKFRLNEHKPAQLIILDNNENEVKSVQLKNENLVYNFRLNISELRAGLYYWKIEDENEVLFVSKFYFVKSE